MVIARRALERLPVSGRILKTIDALRRERDGLRAQRDRLQEQLEIERDRPGPADVASDRPPKVLLAPSFLAYTERLRRVRTASREIHGHADPIWGYNSKPEGVRLAREVGLRVPELIAPPRPLTSVTPPSDRPSVIKPVSGTASRGVSPLVPVGEGLWLNLLERDEGPQTWSNIKESLQRLVDNGRTSRDFLVEELLPGPTPEQLPPDWKFLCIGGDAVLSWVKDNRGQRLASSARYRYFDREWRDLGAIRGRHYEIDETLALPQHPEDLIVAAERIARTLPSIFVRVDLFDTPDGVVFGEITPQPGTPLWFGPELDRELGEIWDRAEARTWARS